MITDKETNIIYFSGLLKERFKTTWEEIRRKLDSCDVIYKCLPNTRDIWARDYMPIQISDHKFLEYRYDPDYLRKDEKYWKEKTYPDVVCDSISLKTIKTDIIIDGGNVVKSSNCVIMTEKVIEENLDFYNKEDLRKKLKNIFEVERIVFIPWDKGERFGHADGMIRFINENEVLIQGYFDNNKDFDDNFRENLYKELDLNGLNKKKLECSNNKKNWPYINFLQTKDLILIPGLNKKEMDDKAMVEISECFPEYDKDRIFQINMSEVVKKGGALNCITWTIK